MSTLLKRRPVATPAAAMAVVNATAHATGFDWGTPPRSIHCGLFGNQFKQAATNFTRHSLHPVATRDWCDLVLVDISLPSVEAREIADMLILNAAPGTATRFIYSHDDILNDAMANTATWACTLGAMPDVEAMVDKPALMASLARVAEAAPAPRLQRLSRIQAAFGLPLATLAEILQRSRTQLYKWLDPLSSVDLQGESLQRLIQLSRLAERWLTESPAATLASVAREPLPHGNTIIQLLSQAPLDETAIVEGFKFLAGLARSRPATASEKLLQRGFERRRRSLSNDD